MIIIRGKIVKGMGAASSTVKHQMPHFLKVCPELRVCRIATINVILECQLDVIVPDLSLAH
jgi:hypothetical protein